MKLSFDPAKRLKTLAERGLDFNDARRIFGFNHITFLDERFAYEEKRWITVGYLRQRMVVLVWTQRGERYHIISMRKANEREQEKYKVIMDRSG
jgi:uncharacterized DUF497 family protein